MTTDNLLYYRQPPSTVLRTYVETVLLLGKMVYRETISRTLQEIRVAIITPSEGDKQHKPYLASVIQEGGRFFCDSPWVIELLLKDRVVWGASSKSIRDLRERFVGGPVWWKFQDDRGSLIKIF